MGRNEGRDRRAGHSGPESGSAIPPAYRLFFQEFVKSHGPTASVLPSSRHLANALLRSIDFSRARTIVELGPGTGVVTREILKRLSPHGKVVAIDINQAFVNHLRNSCSDPRLVPIFGCATGLQSLLADNGIGPVDAVVSSLGLTVMDHRTRTSVIREIEAGLLPGGVMTQYQYIHMYPGHLDIPKMRFHRFDEARFLRRFFRDVSIGHVMLNFPPALVFTCRKEIASQAGAN